MSRRSSSGSDDSGVLAMSIGSADSAAADVDGSLFAMSIGPSAADAGAGQPGLPRLATSEGLMALLMPREGDKTIFRSTQDRRSMRRKYEYNVYSIHTLGDLVDLLITNQPGTADAEALDLSMTDLDTNPSCRYVVGTDYQIRFGLEGSPSAARGVVGHGTISQAALAAGNLLFNDEGEVYAVTNKSGDLEPTDASLSVLLATLVSHGIRLAPEVIIELHQGDIRTYVVSAEVIYAAVGKMYAGADLDKFIRANAGLGTQTLTYTPPEQFLRRGSPLSSPMFMRGGASARRRQRLSPLNRTGGAGFFGSPPNAGPCGKLNFDSPPPAQVACNLFANRALDFGSDSGDGENTPPQGAAAVRSLVFGDL